MLEVPSDFASLSDVYRGNSGKLVICVQHAHANLSGQENLAGALDALMTQYRVKLVLSEGGAGDCSLTPVKKIASSEVWERVAKKYLIEGRLSGEEYLNLTSAHPMKIIGIEDMALYLKSVENYAGLAEKRESILEYLKKIQYAVEKLKTKFYPKELLAYEALKKGDVRGRADRGFEVNLKAFFQLVAQHGFKLDGFPALKELQGIQQEESKIDFDRANLEQAALIEELQKRGGIEDLQSYVKKILQLKSQKLAQLAYFQNTFNIARNKNVDLNKYPELLHYVAYLKTFASLDLEKVLAEVENAEDGLYRFLLKEEDARLLRAIDRYLGLLFTAYRIQMTTREFQLFQANEPDFSTPAYLAFINRKLAESGFFGDLIPYRNILEEGKAALTQFYASVSERDDAFMRNIEKSFEKENEKTAFLITGGYHTAHLKELFKKKGYSYVVLTPFVKTETNQKKYERLLLEPIQKEIRHIEAVNGVVQNRPTAPTAMEEEFLRAKKTSDVKELLEALDPKARFIELQRVKDNVEVLKRLQVAYARQRRNFRTFLMEAAISEGLSSEKAEVVVTQLMRLIGKEEIAIQVPAIAPVTVPGAQTVEEGVIANVGAKRRGEAIPAVTSQLGGARAALSADQMEANLRLVRAMLELLATIKQEGHIADVAPLIRVALGGPAPGLNGSISDAVNSGKSLELTDKLKAFILQRISRIEEIKDGLPKVLSEGIGAIVVLTQVRPPRDGRPLAVLELEAVNEYLNSASGARMAVDETRRRIVQAITAGAVVLGAAPIVRAADTIGKIIKPGVQSSSRPITGVNTKGIYANPNPPYSEQAHTEMAARSLRPFRALDVPSAPVLLPSLKFDTPGDIQAAIEYWRSLYGGTALNGFAVPEGLNLGIPGVDVTDQDRLFRNMIVKLGMFSYDQSRAGIFLVEQGDEQASLELMYRFLNYHRFEFADNRARPGPENYDSFKPGDDNVYGFFDVMPTTGNYMNAVPGFEQFGPQPWAFYNAHGGPNAWLLNWMSQHVLKFGPNADIDKRIRSVADWLLRLQDDQALGAIRFGPQGQYDPSGDSNAVFNTIVTENLMSEISGLMMAYRAAGDERYFNAVVKVIKFLKGADLYNPKTGRFQKGMLNPETGTFFVAAKYNQVANRWELVSDFATDAAGTWSISSLGPELIDFIFEHPGAAHEMALAVHRTTGFRPNWKRARYGVIWGVDFAAQYLGHLISGADGMIQIEQTVGAINAFKLIFDYYSHRVRQRPDIRASIGWRSIYERLYRGDLRFMKYFVDQNHRSYGIGPGLNAPRNGDTGFGWFATPSEVTALISLVTWAEQGDPLASWRDGDEGGQIVERLKEALPTTSGARAAGARIASLTPNTLEAPARGLIAGKWTLLAVFEDLDKNSRESALKPYFGKLLLGSQFSGDWSPEDTQVLKMAYLKEMLLEHNPWLKPHRNALSLSALSSAYDAFASDSQEISPEGKARGISHRATVISQVLNAHRDSIEHRETGPSEVLVVAAIQSSGESALSDYELAAMYNYFVRQLSDSVRLWEQLPSSLKPATLRVSYKAAFRTGGPNGAIIVGPRAQKIFEELAVKLDRYRAPLIHRGIRVPGARAASSNLSKRPASFIDRFGGWIVGFIGVSALVTTFIGMTQSMKYSKYAEIIAEKPIAASTVIASADIQHYYHKGQIGLVNSPARIELRSPKKAHPGDILRLRFQPGDQGKGIVIHLVYEGSPAFWISIGPPAHEVAALIPNDGEVDVRLRENLPTPFIFKGAEVSLRTNNRQESVTLESMDVLEGEPQAEGGARAAGNISPFREEVLGTQLALGKETPDLVVSSNRLQQLEKAMNFVNSIHPAIVLIFRPLYNFLRKNLGLNWSVSIILTYTISGILHASLLEGINSLVIFVTFLAAGLLHAASGAWSSKGGRTETSARSKLPGSSVSQITGLPSTSGARPVRNLGEGARLVSNGARAAAVSIPDEIKIILENVRHDPAYIGLIAAYVNRSPSGAKQALTRMTSLASIDRQSLERWLDGYLGEGKWSRTVFDYLNGLLQDDTYRTIYQHVANAHLGYTEPLGTLAGDTLTFDLINGMLVGLRQKCDVRISGFEKDAVNPDTFEIQIKIRHENYPPDRSGRNQVYLEASKEVSDFRNAFMRRYGNYVAIAEDADESDAFRLVVNKLPSGARAAAQAPDDFSLATEVDRTIRILSDLKRKSDARFEASAAPLLRLALRSIDRSLRQKEREEGGFDFNKTPKSSFVSRIGRIELLQDGQVIAVIKGYISLALLVNSNTPVSDGKVSMARVKFDELAKVVGYSAGALPMLGTSAPSRGARAAGKEQLALTQRNVPVITAGLSPDEQALVDVEVIRRGFPPHYLRLAYELGRSTTQQKSRLIRDNEALVMELEERFGISSPHIAHFDRSGEPQRQERLIRRLSHPIVAKYVDVLLNGDKSIATQYEKSMTRAMRSRGIVVRQSHRGARLGAAPGAVNLSLEDQARIHSLLANDAHNITGRDIFYVAGKSGLSPATLNAYLKLNGNNPFSILFPEDVDEKAYAVALHKGQQVTHPSFQRRGYVTGFSSKGVGVKFGSDKRNIPFSEADKLQPVASIGARAATLPVFSDFSDTIVLPATGKDIIDPHEVVLRGYITEEIQGPVKRTAFETESLAAYEAFQKIRRDESAGTFEERQSIWLKPFIGKLHQSHIERLVRPWRLNPNFINGVILVKKSMGLSKTDPIEITITSGAPTPVIEAFIRRSDIAEILKAENISFKVLGIPIVMEPDGYFRGQILAVDNKVIKGPSAFPERSLVLGDNPMEKYGFGNRLVNVQTFDPRAAEKRIQSLIESGARSALEITTPNGSLIKGGARAAEQNIQPAEGSYLLRRSKITSDLNTIRLRGYEKAGNFGTFAQMNLRKGTQIAILLKNGSLIADGIQFESVTEGRLNYEHGSALFHNDGVDIHSVFVASHASADDITPLSAGRLLVRSYPASKKDIRAVMQTKMETAIHRIQTVRFGDDELPLQRLHQALLDRLLDFRPDFIFNESFLSSMDSYSSIFMLDPTRTDTGRAAVMVSHTGIGLEKIEDDHLLEILLYSLAHSVTSSNENEHFVWNNPVVDRVRQSRQWTRKPEAWEQREQPFEYRNAEGVNVKFGDAELMALRDKLMKTGARSALETLLQTDRLSRAEPAPGFLDNIADGARFATAQLSRNNVPELSLRDKDLLTQIAVKASGIQGANFEVKLNGGEEKLTLIGSVQDIANGKRLFLSVNDERGAVIQVPYDIPNADIERAAALPSVTTAQIRQLAVKSRVIGVTREITAYVSAANHIREIEQSVAMAGVADTSKHLVIFTWARTLLGPDVRDPNLTKIIAPQLALMRGRPLLGGESRVLIGRTANLPESFVKLFDTEVPLGDDVLFHLMVPSDLVSPGADLQNVINLFAQALRDANIPGLSNNGARISAITKHFSVTILPNPRAAGKDGYSLSNVQSDFSAARLTARIRSERINELSDKVVSFLKTIIPALRTTFRGSEGFRSAFEALNRFNPKFGRYAELVVAVVRIPIDYILKLVGAVQRAVGSMA